MRRSARRMRGLCVPDGDLCTSRWRARTAQSEPMNDETRVATVRRSWLAMVTGVTAVSVATGAVGLAAGETDLGVVVDSRLPWHSIVFAGIALAVVVAVPMALACYLAIRDRAGYQNSAAVAGLLLLGWIGVEIAVIQEFSWLQLVFAAVGFVVFFMAAPRHSHHRRFARSNR